MTQMQTSYSSDKTENPGLFDGRFWPSTVEVGFLEIDAEVAAAFYARWQGGLEEERGGTVVLTEQSSRVGLSAALESLLPLTSTERRRMIFVPTSSEWCAYFDNGWRGTDAFSAMSYMSQMLSCRGVRARYAPHTAEKVGSEWRGEFGATILELYSAKSTDWLNVERTLYCTFDAGKWEFGQSGSVQDFEDVEFYKARSIKDRFTFEILNRYLKEINIQAFDETFYMDEGRFFHAEKFGPCNSDLREYGFPRQTR